VRDLLMFRHAKSDWTADNEDDHGRPLNPRGRRAAPRMGRFLRRIGEMPDRVVTSSALRASETVRLAAEAGGWDAPIEASSDLYESSPEAVLEVIRRCPDDARTLLLAGHEPVWSLTAGGLVGGAGLRFPTAAIACIRFPVDRWSEVRFGAGELRWFVTPKLLERIGIKRS